MARIAVHVTPRSGRDEVAGWRGSELSVRVTSPPEDGKANAAVCRTLATSLGVAKSTIKVVRGGGARHKVVEIDGVGDEIIEQVFGRPDESLF
ncbi:MAG: hypothetical protein CVT67_00945 [Actinobacteria bacterium HGW-Actinobacteria-7]|jgi:hypothetical protein|nr:MAG: hypothetical protein CVT67_00945 [Actinobacteria bacterium HGW-Actinobacteria-7]